MTKTRYGGPHFIVGIALVPVKKELDGGFPARYIVSTVDYIPTTTDGIHEHIIRATTYSSSVSSTGIPVHRSFLSIGRECSAQ